jgi:dihydrodipicolinate synthase/N-acetylneuraminate lyase
MIWSGVMPAITTPFHEDMTIDHAFLARHCRWLAEHGCTGVVALGSLGEGATLTLQEKRQVLETCVAAIGQRAFVVSGVSALSTDEAKNHREDCRNRGLRRSDGSASLRLRRGLA